MRVEKRKLLEMIHWVPATPNDVIIFYVISLVSVLSQKKFSLALPRPMRALPDQARYFPMPRTGVMAVLTKLQQFAML